MPARDLTPEQKADGARAVLVELRKLYDSRFESLMLAAGVREICDHYGAPWPLALASPGALDSLDAIGAAVDEYAALCEKQFPADGGRSRRGDAAAPAVAG